MFTASPLVFSFSPRVLAVGILAAGLLFAGQANAAPESAPKPLDVETLARNPAWWPKEISLMQALEIPVTANGRISGKMQLPANTTVQLLRITSAGVEFAYLNQRALAPIAATDALTRAAELEQAAQTNPAPMAATQNPLANGRYREEAETVMDDIQNKYWLPQAQRYAKKPGSREPDLVWGAGVMFSALVGAVRNEPDRYKPLLGKFFDGLNGYWDAKASPPGYEPAPTSGNGHDKYYDDNAWLAITFFEAYELTHLPQYRRRADETLDFVLSGWDEALGGGVWWHELHEKKSPGKNTCANAPTAVACLISAKLQPGTQASRERLVWAEKIIRWTTEKLQLENGLFADSISLDGGMNRAQLTYNSALMLRANLGAYRATRNARYLAEAQRIGRAGEAFMDPSKGAFRDAEKWAHLMVEADLELYRTTHEDYLATRARKNADYYFDLWKNHPPEDLISEASIARTLWLMADAESDSGRRFWQMADAGALR